MRVTESMPATPIALDRDLFMRRLIASLGHLHESILGSDIAGAYIINVGLSMGAAIEAEYKRAWKIDRPFTRDEYSHVIVDLKQKIQGNFSLVHQDDDKVVVRTTSCPFDEFVRQSPSLCFMTSSVFGGIAARNFGYAKVVLHKRIALGDPGCYVSVYLRRTPESEAAVGREYFPEVDRASPDIAEQLRLMESMRALRRQLGEASSRWDELVRGAAEAVSIFDPAGSIIFANARWRDLLGVEGEELIGSTLMRLVHPDDQSIAEGLMTRVGEGQRVTGQSLRLRHRDESWRDVLISAGPVHDDQGLLVGTVALFRDVTAERDAQRLKDEFLSTASHELRTPVTTIKMMTELLLRLAERDEPIDRDQLTRRLRRIREESDRLAFLGADLLDAARHQAGKLTLSPEPHDLSDIVATSVARQHDLLPSDSQHSIVLDRPPTPLSVSVERPRIEQVIANLLDNAVKYSPHGGEIRVRITPRPDAGHAELTVSDQGIGIPSDELQNVFSPFFRGSNASSRTFSGLGLGLYLCKAIAEAHGGDLTVSSTPDHGTTFTLSLPLHRAANAREG